MSEAKPMNQLVYTQIERGVLDTARPVVSNLTTMMSLGKRMTLRTALVTSMHTALRPMKMAVYTEARNWVSHLNVCEL